jgi:small-conductance mechanosensitive channel
MDPAALSVPLAPLPIPPHRLEDLFWGRALPVLVVLLAAGLAAAAGRAVALRPHDPSRMGPNQFLRRLLRGIVQGLVFLGVLSAAVLLDKALHGDPRGLDMTERAATVVAALWGGFLGLNAATRHLGERLHRNGRAAAAAVLPLLSKIALAAWALLVFVLFLENLGLDMKALLAGLGVGGLAVALAGQKTMENLFGGVMLVLDQPVRVGDECRFGDRQGTVEDVGLRSIKIRTADRTVITVPNGDFSQLQIENFARRDRIKFSTLLALRSDTKADQVKAILARIQERLDQHADLDHDQVRRVRLVALASYSLELEVFCYFKTTDADLFLVQRQVLLLDLMADVEGAGAALAYPTQTTVVEQRS